MRFLASFLIGTTTAAVFHAPGQQVLQLPSKNDAPQSRPATVSDQNWAEKLGGKFEKALSALTAAERRAWDEVAMLLPKEMVKENFISSPKKHTKRPDDYWNHIIKGADVQSVWVENADGEKEREVHGKLEDYSLRTKKVDTRKLGVDPGVKQFSGYLDDDENDKHLFYCKLAGFGLPFLN